MCSGSFVISRAREVVLEHALEHLCVSERPALNPSAGANQRLVPPWPKEKGPQIADAGSNY